MNKSDKEIEDELLGRWLAGDVNEEELHEFEQSAAFKTYQAIADYTGRLEAPSYDTGEELIRLKSKISDENNTPIVSIKRNRFIAMAAGIAALIGVGLTIIFWGSQDFTSHVTAQGETKSIELPDESMVALNVASTLTYDEENWQNERKLTLEGEAFFEVTKGNRFLVETDQGTVEVLGTSFNIRNRNTITEVICYEGKVKVSDLKGNHSILTVGDVARIENGLLGENWAPPVSGDADWKNGFSTFHLSPFNDVIDELENQYRVHVKVDRNIDDRLYSGSFPHDNFQDALRLIFEPMALEYNIENDTLISVE